MNSTTAFLSFLTNITKRDGNLLDCACLSTVIEEYSPVNVVYFTTTSGGLIKGVGGERSWTVLGEEYGEYGKVGRLFHRDFYVVEIEEATRLEPVLRALYKTDFFSTLSVFVVVCVKRISHTKIFAILWKYYVVRAYVVGVDRALFTYQPLEAHRCGNSVPIALPVRTERVSVDLRTREVFTGCAFKYAAIMLVPVVGPEPEFEKDSGFIFKFLREIVRLLQLKPHKHEHNYTSTGIKQADGTVRNMFDRFPNGSYSGLFQDVYESKVDLLVGPIPYSQCCDFDFTYSHLQLDSKFFVPLAKTIPRWKNLALIYDGITWLCIMVSTLVFTFTWRAYFDNQRTFSAAFLLAISALFTTNTYNLPTRTQRVLYLTWCYACFILSSSFQCLLISFLFKPIRENQITTAEDLAGSGLPIASLKSSIDVLAFTNNRHVQQLYNKTERVLTIDPAHWQQLVAGKLSLFVSVFVAGSYVNQTHMEHIKMLKQSYSIYGTMVLRRGSPFTRAFNHFVKRFQEHGLLAKWMPYRPYSINRITQEFHVIRYEHVKLAVYLFLCGIGVSLLLFVIEILVYKSKKLNKHAHLKLHFM